MNKWQISKKEYVRLQQDYWDASALAFRIAFTNGLMSESMIVWFLLMFSEIGRRERACM